MTIPCDSPEEEVYWFYAEEVQWTLFTVVTKGRSPLLNPPGSGRVASIWENRGVPSSCHGSVLSVCVTPQVRSVLNFVLTHSVLSNVWSALPELLFQPFQSFYLEPPHYIENKQTKNKPCKENSLALISLWIILDHNNCFFQKKKK